MKEIQQAWAALFIGGLYNAGVKNVVLCPGSRSGPLALAALGHPKLHCEVIIDERSAAFYALGQIRYAKHPTAVICTSGTAGAHFGPAIEEASLSCLPLIVITADRPWYLQHCGANQTVHQQDWFSTKVRGFFELGEPSKNIIASSAAQRIATQAAFTAQYPLPGPVHINARLIKPLEPVAWPTMPPTKICELSPTQCLFPPRGASSSSIELLTQYCENTQKGIIVCGPRNHLQDTGDFAAAIELFSLQTGFPVWAETASAQNRTHPHFTQYFGWLLQNDVPSSHMPSLIIELNAPLTIGAYQKFIETHPTLPRLVLNEHAFIDPFSSADAMLIGNIPQTLTQAANLLPKRSNNSWQIKYATLDSKISSQLNSYFQTVPFNQLTVTATIGKNIRPETTLCIGNSLVVRDIDLFSTRPSLRNVLHQRGASGIDGLISSAAGAAAASHQPVMVLLGDVSALHDLGGFALLSKVSNSLTVVIINNNGGRIFDTLPLASVDGIHPALKKAFVVDQSPSFEGICAMFSLRYHKVTHMAPLKELLQDAQCTKGATVIEIQVDVGINCREELREQMNQMIHNHRPKSSI